MKCFRCEEDAKYKCPACREGYCSLECAKIHKLECTQVELNEAKKRKDSNSEEQVKDMQIDDKSEEESAQISKFDVLSKSQKLKDMIWDDPILQNYIKTINSSDEPTIFLDQLKGNARFIEFSNLVKDLLSKN